MIPAHVLATLLAPLLLQLPMPAAPRPPVPDTLPIVVRVLVLNFDPVLEARDDLPLHAALGWRAPRQLAAKFMREVATASHGRVQYHIVEWQDLDAFPVKLDGFTYTDSTWLACWADRATCYQPDGSDYPRLLAEHGVPARIDRGEIDELWIFGAPYLGFWESAMAGPDAFEINGGVYDSVAVSKRFAIMGFSYERGVAEMLHNLCHRTEATMTHLHGGWRADELVNSWARFAANAHQSNGVAAVGTCHYPPNGEKDYDYANPRTVSSTADDYLDYPELGGSAMPVSRETWGGPEYHLNYMRWWFTRLPHAPGRAPDGTLNDWWRYVYLRD
jgi:hypothetical protein